MKFTNFFRIAFQENSYGQLLLKVYEILEHWCSHFFPLKVLCYLQSEEIWVAVLQNKYMFAKNYHLHWIAGRANILRQYIMYILWAWLLRFLSYVISKTSIQPLVVKKNWTNFCCIVLLHLWAQKLCLRFLKSYFKLEILIFLPFVASTKNLLFWRKEHQRCLRTP